MKKERRSERDVYTRWIYILLSALSPFNTIHAITRVLYSFRIDAFNQTSRIWFIVRMTHRSVMLLTCKQEEVRNAHLQYIDTITSQYESNCESVVFIKCEVTLSLIAFSLTLSHSSIFSSGPFLMAIKWADVSHVFSLRF